MSDLEFMQLISSPSEMQRTAIGLRAANKRIAFVPTMGALHEGHLTLLREGKKRGDVLILSIYVNPAQFAPTEDLAKYPRDKEGDLAKAKECGTDIVFFPSDDAMYPSGYQTRVEVTGVTEGLCGASRPTHFRGVTTIVQKLLNIVQPHLLLLGEKDYQQLAAIRTMVRDLNIPVEVIGVPTVRETDGLAMSSRNAYLSPEEREAALSLSKGLFAAQRAFKGGETRAERLIKTAEDAIKAASLPRLDYLKTCDAETLKELDTIDRPARLLAAIYIGKTRLIDNCALE
jgi:pantoate--beta-alanine ligase